MTASPTFASRLRILIARSFRAEKVYAGLRVSDKPKISSVAALSEYANDLRAREWQRSHSELRSALNEMIKSGVSAETRDAVSELRKRFAQRASEARRAVEKGKEAIVEASAREEFAHVMKLSVELLRCKARAQADKSIADELGTLVDREVVPPSGAEDGQLLKEAMAGEAESVLVEESSRHRKVVPLRRVYP